MHDDDHRAVGTDVEVLTGKSRPNRQRRRAVTIERAIERA